MKLTTCLHLLPTSRMFEALPLCLLFTYGAMLSIKASKMFEALPLCLLFTYGAMLSIKATSLLYLHEAFTSR